MLSLHFQLIELRPLKTTQSLLNSMVRESLRAALLYWLRVFRPQHFGKGASARYKYVPRARRYNEAKARFGWVWNYHLKVRMLRPKPVEDLQYTGDLKERVTGPAPTSFNIVATATANRSSARVGVPLGWPYSKKIADEVTLLLQEEERVLHAVAMAHMRAQIQAGAVIPAREAYALAA